MSRRDSRRLEGRPHARSVSASILRDARLRRAPQDEVCGFDQLPYMIGFMESVSEQSL